MRRTLIFLILFVYWSSCDDIFITDLSAVSVELVTPPNGFQTTNPTISFFWETLDDATEYQLRVVKPNFDFPEEVILDETITDNLYEYTFNPGQYEWRVIAINSASQTSADNIRSFEILNDSTLQGQTVNIISPDNQTITNDNALTILWQPLPLASKYHIQIGSPDFSHPSFIQLEDSTDMPSFSTTLTEGIYQIRVKAANEQSESEYSAITYEIDNTPPTAPTLISPSENDTLQSPITLVWDADNSAIGDSIYVATDSLFTQTVIRDYTTNLDYSFSLSTIGLYYWKIHSVDEAGNVSANGEIRSFLIE